jgi:hypothetical protein
MLQRFCLQKDARELFCTNRLWGFETLSLTGYQSVIVQKRPASHSV